MVLAAGFSLDLPAFDGVFLDLIYLGRLVCAGGILFVDDYQLPLGGAVK
jgi:hypothetical protein